MVRWTIPWYVVEAEGRRARQCSCCQPSLTILCATLPDLLQSPPWVKILPWDPLPCQNLPHWDMHTCAHTRWCTHTHTHLALARKLVRSLCPSLFYPVTRHSSFTHSMLPDGPSAAWPMSITLLNFHCCDLPPSALQTPDSIPILHRLQSGLLWTQGTETHSSWFNNKLWVLVRQEGGTQVIVRRPRSHDTPKMATIVGPGTGSKAATMSDSLSRGPWYFYWCLCSSLYTCFILLFLLTDLLRTFAHKWPLTFDRAPCLYYSLSVSVY